MHVRRQQQPCVRGARSLLPATAHWFFKACPPRHRSLCPGPPARTCHQSVTQNGSNLDQATDRQALHRHQTHMQGAAAVRSIAYSADGSWLASCGDDRSVRVHDGGSAGRVAAAIQVGEGREATEHLQHCMPSDASGPAHPSCSIASNATAGWMAPSGRGPQGGRGTVGAVGGVAGMCVREGVTGPHSLTPLP